MEIVAISNLITNAKTTDIENELHTPGVLKQLNPNRLHPAPPSSSLPSLPHIFTYKECLKNHAATLGGHALDGCGEFMPPPNADSSNPTSLTCDACGCHRNFHRRHPEDRIPSPPPISTLHHVIEYQPHHRHHPPPPLSNLSPNSSSPPPISSSYYNPSVTRMLLALKSGITPPPDSNNTRPAWNSGSRKRVRTKFTQNQKEKMHEFADKVGWKIQKGDEDMISSFCNDVGVDKTVLKVWMHNNKSTFIKKDSGINGGGVDINTSISQYHHNMFSANGSSSCRSLIESTAK